MEILLLFCKKENCEEEENVNGSFGNERLWSDHRAPQILKAIGSETKRFKMVGFFSILTPDL